MKPDCIIVLANLMEKLGVLNSESEARVVLASKLYFNNPDATLITCGWDYIKGSKLCISDVQKEYAIKLGVPAKKILTDIYSRDTVGDALFTKLNFIKKTYWKNILVVTSSYHVARASKIFKFIYGPQYQIEVVGSDGDDSIEKQLSEKKSFEVFQKTFNGINTGDDLAIYERILTRHPFYNGEVHPKINIDF